jgi:hypothetical protein
VIGNQFCRGFRHIHGLGFQTLSDAVSPPVDAGTDADFWHVNCVSVHTFSPSD